jgi:hypothetical protein
MRHLSSCCRLIGCGSGTVSNPFSYSTPCVTSFIETIRITAKIAGYRPGKSNHSGRAVGGPEFLAIAARSQLSTGQESVLSKISLHGGGGGEPDSAL